MLKEFQKRQNLKTAKPTGIDGTQDGLRNVYARVGQPHSLEIKYGHEPDGGISKYYEPFQFKHVNIQFENHNTKLEQESDFEFFLQQEISKQKS